jgi:prepilin-type N-terminal cleavage/methylation domain-containing protein
VKGNSRETQDGFTIIEIMIVIAIIGILAAIAVPNFLSYRNKSFCLAAEADANYIAGALSDYFAIPTNISFIGASGTTIHFPGGATITLSGSNTATVTPTGTDTFDIKVTDESGRCPLSYRIFDSHWSNGAKGIYSKAF